MYGGGRRSPSKFIPAAPAAANIIIRRCRSRRAYDTHIIITYTRGDYHT